jgi:hypothetical protein
MQVPPTELTPLYTCRPQPSLLLVGKGFTHYYLPKQKVQHKIHLHAHQIQFFNLNFLNKKVSLRMERGFSIQPWKPTCIDNNFKNVSKSV